VLTQGGARMKILIWHVHGSWMTAFVRGHHTYFVPRVEGRGPDGLGRARTWDWPSSVVEVTPEEIPDTAVDVVVLQRPRELELATAWLGGRVPGRDVPMIWLEHNAPQGLINEMRHPMADRDDVAIVHVTHTNALFWDTGTTRSTVIEHGIIDPGHRYTGEVAAAGVVVNEPVRRARVAGTDLLSRFAAAGPVDVFGMGVESLPGELGHPDWLTVHEDLPQEKLHDVLAQRRCYVHPFRWTSLGLSLIEAMSLGMPVVSLATTEAPEAIGDCGVVSNDLSVLVDGIRELLDDPDHAAGMGRAARARALDRYGLDRFLGDWNRLLEEM
jgi:glycosyltransferase involved in cell wall biosynthesis